MRTDSELWGLSSGVCCLVQSRMFSSVSQVPVEIEEVTYSTVKAPSSSSAGASADPYNLYATITK